MEALIKTFHIDLKLLLAQAINFAIVFLVLYYFVIKPLLKIMEKRSKKIENSLKNAEEIKKELARAEKDYGKKIKKARFEAGVIMEKAEKQSEERKKRMLEKAKEEIGLIINKEKEKIQQEKSATLKEIRKEVGNLVADSVEKILEKKVSDKEDIKLIKKIVKKI